MPYLGGRNLRVTARHHNSGRRILPSGTAYQPTRFGIGFCRHRTGIDYIYIGNSGKGNYPESLFQESFPHGSRLKLISLAAKCSNGNFFHYFPCEPLAKLGVIVIPAGF
jgi:hypothetical protein